MSVQSEKSVRKRFQWSLAGVLFLVIGATTLFVNKHHGDAQPPTRLINAGAAAAAGARESNSMDTKIDKMANEKIAVPKDYYDQLPPLEEVIAELKSLESKEIDEKIKEVEQDLASSELIEKSNAKTLDDAGYRQLAQLIQLSDALYNVKIERQLSALEIDLGIKKKGT